MILSPPKKLPLNFCQGFYPERRFLSSLLKFTLNEGSGTKTEIRDQTGIPTGDSSGKVEPTIHFATGMGLIESTLSAGSWQLSLTSLGKVIFQEDPYLSDSQTMWMLHLMLCRRYDLTMPASGIADVWFTLSADSFVRLGSSFTQQAFHDLLVERFGDAGYIKVLAGTAVRTYVEESYLGLIRVFRVQGSGAGADIERLKAPADSTYYPFYSAYLFLIWDQLFPNENQIDLKKLADESRFLVLLGWNDIELNSWLGWMVDRDLVQQDRHTGSVMLLRLASTLQVVNAIYSELD